MVVWIKEPQAGWDFLEYLLRTRNLPFKPRNLPLVLGLLMTDALADIL